MGRLETSAKLELGHLGTSVKRERGTMGRYPSHRKISSVLMSERLGTRQVSKLKSEIKEMNCAGE